MKKLITLTGLILLSSLAHYGQTFDSGSTGADGPFNPPAQVPDGTQVTGNCAAAPGCTVTVPLREPPNHIFNFTTVTVGPFVTVRFRRNAANTPVLILASGDVTVNGVINVSGESGAPGFPPARGGPGGYDSGTGGMTSGDGIPGSGGAGGGPGGGGFYSPWWHGRFLGVVGNSELLPLIGGSGGLGGGVNGAVRGGHGGGGGGALLIASSGIINLGMGTGNAIVANGGVGETVAGGNRGYSGSGGAIRLLARTIRGQSGLVASGGQPGDVNGEGRIRLETLQVSEYAGSTYPAASLGEPGIVGPVFPPLAPTIRIVSVAGVSAPEQPTSDVGMPDVSLPSDFTNPVTIQLEATNVPSGTRALVRIAPQYGSGGASISQPVTLTGPAGQPKRGSVTLSLPARGVGVISAIIDSVVPGP